MNLEAVVFDMDGILFDTERLYTECWYEIAKRNHIENIEKAVLYCVGLNHADTYAYFYREYGDDFPAKKFMEEASALFWKKIRNEGLPIKKGVKETLAYLEKSPYQIGLASSSRRESVLSHLEEAGLRQYFHYIIGGDMVSHSKPDPDIYVDACRQLAVNPENAIAVEDSPNGIRSAYGAGMKVVMIPDLIEPDEEIKKLLFQQFSSMEELLEYLKSIN